MGFSWRPNVADTNDIYTEDLNEFKTHLDTLYGDLDLTPYSFDYFNMAERDPVTNPALQELRDATDNADDQNYCRNHNATHDSTVDGDDNATDNASNNASVDSGDNGTYYGLANSLEKSNNKTLVYSNYDSNVDNDDNGVDRSANYGTFDTGDDAVVNNSYNEP